MTRAPRPSVTGPAVTFAYPCCPSTTRRLSTAGLPPATDDLGVVDAGTALRPPLSPTSLPPPVALTEPVVELVEAGQFDQPVEVVTLSRDSRLFVVEQTGRVLAVDDESNEVVLDISTLVSGGNEQGLLGLAFHPSADLAYVNYTDRSGDTIVAEHVVEPLRGSSTRPRPARCSRSTSHCQSQRWQADVRSRWDVVHRARGRGLRRRPDRNGLDLATPLGKILRIDPVATDAEPYTVPADNPFVGVEGADPRIWSLGLRNPWRFSFDSATGDLWIADVGQDEFEEINHAPAAGGLGAGRGLSFGWSAFEGNSEFNADQTADGHTPPVHVYSHDEGGCSVSGGVVARDSTVPNLSGWYLFGDYCTGEIWALDPAGAPDAPRIVALANLEGVAAISVGGDGQLYAVSNGGTIARFVAP